MEQPLEHLNVAYKFLRALVAAFRPLLRALEPPDDHAQFAAVELMGLIDVLEQNYGGDITKMPYVVNKEAFAS